MKRRCNIEVGGSYATAHLCLTRRWEARTVCFCCIMSSVAIAASAFLLEPAVHMILRPHEANVFGYQSSIPVVSPRNKYLCCEDPKVMGVESASRVGLFGGMLRSFTEVPCVCSTDVLFLFDVL